MGKIMVGAAASSAEQAKRRKYENLDSSFIFVPFGVETLGQLGPEAKALFKELSKRVIESTGDPRAASYFTNALVTVCPSVPPFYLSPENFVMNRNSTVNISYTNR
ncbi:jg9118 [Pararge aegeria aegeria]|uniref:Jg9118 protein n=1 Tax=Pararge aegeria aegeria TaxID=348720 RepID=A0A8S4SBX1_9NEOP|nr:jg9118 [Pararge aegeria aegeria]